MRATMVDLGGLAGDLAAQWATLGGDTTTNVFLHLAALAAVQATRFAQVHVLRAWAGEPDGRLVGVWALQRSLVRPFGSPCLATPPYEHAFLSNPVLDHRHMDEAMTAFFDLIASDDRLPGVLRLRYLDAECPSFGAIVRALAARGAPRVEVSRHGRPYATRALLEPAATTRRKLRQKWNRLCTLGTVAVRNERSTDAVCQAFEAWLALEAASWKGQYGTALLCNPGDAGFARRWIAALAAQGSASVAMLTVDDRAIAAQVLLYSGSTAYTWKIAFDAQFGPYSPGAVLVGKVTEHLFAMDGIEAIESCSPEGGFMYQMWHGRRETVDLFADLGGKRALEFSAAAMGARTYAQLREMRNALRGSPRSPRAMHNPGTGG